jgi:hypothetical protein
MTERKKEVICLQKNDLQSKDLAYEKLEKYKASKELVKAHYLA